METKEISKVGYGSFFHTIEPEKICNFNLNKYIPNYSLFYTGRHAIKYILEKVSKEKKINKIWLPKYYCQHVTSWLQNCFSNISFYNINPFSPELEFNISQFTDKHDIVILNNFWGVFKYKIPKNKEQPTFIEDHSHGWLSTNCLHSEADYCFASLRKTIPIPLGGILWKPNEVITKPKSLIADSKFYNNWDTIESAMFIKKEALNSTKNIEEEKNYYLSLINQSEKYLHNQYNIIQLKEKHKKTILSYINKDYNLYKKSNLTYILSKINKTSLFKIIEGKNETTFGLNIVFNKEETFKNFKSFLIRKNIYPSELWPGNKLNSNWCYLLNIHIDYRYSKKDMDYIVTSINNFTN